MLWNNMGYPLSMPLRRTFLAQFGSALLLPAWASGARSLKADIAVIGAGVGGCAAALAALRNGRTVILTEETDWIGGQLTSQAVPPDEHPWIESFGATQSYRDYRNNVREYYRQRMPLSATARASATLNPGGGGGILRLGHEPRVSVAVLESMLSPYIGGGQLTVLLKHRPVSADTQGDAVRAINVQSLASGTTTTIEASYFLDASETGELLPLTKTEYVTGVESQRETGEMHAPSEANPASMQACTVCFAIEYREGENHVADPPEDYKFWRDYVPQLKPEWTGRLLSLDYPNPQSHQRRTVNFDPSQPERIPGSPLNLWFYRRIAARSSFQPGAYASDISLVNWPQNDYWLGNLFDVPADKAASNLKQARQLSLSFYYWLQTEAPRADGNAGWPGLRIRPDQTGTEDGLAKYPYIRESRRIRAEFTVCEQHVGTQSRAPQTEAETFPDSVGIGAYRIDIHPTTGGDNYIDVSSLPFQIPLGALIPKRMENLLPACKNLGVTHITNGCYRLHPVEWNIGEAAGVLAAHALRTNAKPRQIRNEAKRFQEFQAVLIAQGVEVRWPPHSSTFRPL